MEIKIVTVDADENQVPTVITAKWLKVVLPVSHIVRDRDGRYDIQFPNGTSEYLFGFWNEFTSADALRCGSNNNWDCNVAYNTIWGRRTAAAERMLDEVIDLCETFEDNYDPNEEIEIKLKVVIGDIEAS